MNIFSKEEKERLVRVLYSFWKRMLDPEVKTV